MLQLEHRAVVLRTEPPRGLGPSGFHPLREAQSTVHFSDDFIRVSAKRDEGDPEG
jgi:hypothetical protein